MNTTDTTVNIASINDRAMLVYLRIGVWSARKLDTRATRKVTSDSHATDDGARVHKHLLASADEKLRAIQHIGGKARRYVEDSTLPWDDAGNRLLPNEDAIKVVSGLTELEDEFNAAVDAFVVDYPQLREQALTNLGSLGNAEDYPPPEVIRTKFSFRLSFSPIAKNFSDIRVGLAPQQVEALQEHYQKNASRQVGEALVAAWKRLQENLEKYSDRLQPRADEPDKMQVFRDTMVENLRETCAMLGTMNVFGDVQLESVRRRVERDIAVFAPDHLRGNPQMARAVKSEVDAVLDHMRSILGE